jgi:hypothetical protein
MKLELNTDKTKITKFYHDKALFLGVQFFMSKIYTYRKYWKKKIYNKEILEIIDLKLL